MLENTGQNKTHILQNAILKNGSTQKYSAAWGRRNHQFRNDHYADREIRGTIKDHECERLDGVLFGQPQDKSCSSVTVIMEQGWGESSEVSRYTWGQVAITRPHRGHCTGFWVQSTVPISTVHKLNANGSSLGGEM